MWNIVRGSYSFLDKTILFFLFKIVYHRQHLFDYLIYLYENGIQFGYRKNTLNPVIASLIVNHRRDEKRREKKKTNGSIVLWIRK